MLMERVLGMGASVIVSVWVARYLGARNFGILSYALAFVAFFTPIASLGVNNILVKELIVDRPRERVLLGSAVALRLIGTAAAVILCAGTVWISKGAANEVFWAVLALALAHVCSALDVGGLWLQSKMEVRRLMFFRMGITVFCAALRVVAIWRGAGLFAFVLIAAAETLAVDIGNVVVYRSFDTRPRGWNVERGTMRALLNKSWPLILSAVAASIYLKIDQVMIAEMVSLDASGVYAVAARVSEVWYFIPQILATALFPSLLNTKLASLELYQRRMQISLCFFALAATAIALAVSLSADFVITTLFGAEYAEAAVILQVHIWAGVFIFLRALLSKWLIAENLYIFSFVSHGLGAVLNVVLNSFMIPKWGALGAAIATVISYAGASYLFAFCDRRTWIMGKMMTEALLWPVFLPLGLLRHKRAGGARHE
jgi:PST family polysaccharide transporter